MSDANNHAVRTDAVWKVFEQEAEEVQAVRDVSLTIAPGEFTAIAGPSGSGKTTLLNLIGGLTRPTRGQIWVAGNELSAMSNQDLAQLRLDHVGFTSMISRAEAPALTKKLEALRGDGFTGKAPGGPSRWSTDRTSTYEPLRHELVVEVTYDHMSGGRFRHGTRLVRWRPDKAPGQCTWEQVAPAAPASGPVAEALTRVSRGA